MKCAKCGSESADTNTYCDYCGERLHKKAKSRRSLRDALSRCLDGKYDIMDESKGYEAYKAGSALGSRFGSGLED